MKPCLLECRTQHSGADLLDTRSFPTLHSCTIYARSLSLSLSLYVSLYVSLPSVCFSEYTQDTQYVHNPGLNFPRNQAGYV